MVNVQAGVRIKSKATETFHSSEGDPAVYEDTHNLHRQAEKIKESNPFRHEYFSILTVAAREITRELSPECCLRMHFR